MFSQGAADVPYTLLHFMGGELIDVAKGRIVQPGNPVFTVIRCHPPCIGFNWFGCCQATLNFYPHFDPLGLTKMM